MKQKDQKINNIILMEITTRALIIELINMFFIIFSTQIACGDFLPE